MIFILIFVVGIIAGFINTLAGGGSTLVLPVLILAGLPSPIANATNRVAILLQNATATKNFHKHNVLKIKPIIHITIAAILGAIAGSFFAISLDSALFDKLLGIIFIFILLMLLHPKQKRKSRSLPKWIEFIIFFMVGFYGGFIQAGVGFIFLTTLNIVEDYDLIHANAVKVFIILCYTIFSVVIFAISGKIFWMHGLILACGNSIGAYIGVKAAITGGEKIVKVVLTIAILITCLKLFGVLKLFEL
ncbi:MAG: sulfite exporter TauE/SafE family protein [Candidatus Tenebribacter mawsonii]|nr:sulfite exporter TauE/SafE family protein [Candidatus Tenebribacter mawsonii]